MRLPKEVIGKVRRGELDVVRRPVANKPCPFKAGRFYALERVEDRHEENCPECAGEGCDECRDHGTVIVYEKRATTMDGEYIEIESVTRQPLHWADDVEADAWGFGTREEYIEDWQSENGKNIIDTYVVHFRYAVDLPHLLSRSGGYTHTDFDAMEGEPESVDATTLDTYVLENQQGDLVRHAARRARWEAKSLADRVAALEADPSTGVEQMASLKKRIEQLERRQQRKAA